MANKLVNSQRKVGDIADILITGRYPGDFPYDFENHYDGIGVRTLVKMVKTARIARNYDVVHLHGGINWKRLDIPAIKFIKKRPILVHYHGSETRLGYGAYYPWLADIKVVATPDLLEWWPESKYIPTPIDIEEYESSFPDGDRPKILHIPTNRKIKGTDIVIDAIDSLRSEGYEFDFRLLEDISHKEAMKVMSESHIVIDWISRPEITGIPGIFGLTSLEAMAMGKVSVAYIQPSMVKHYADGLPIINPNEPTVKALKDILGQHLGDMDELKKIGEKGREFVQKNYNPRTVMKEFSSAYQMIIDKTTKS